jgi:predicted SAM-dependent methyltransferase
MKHLRILEAIRPLRYLASRSIRYLWLVSTRKALAYKCRSSGDVKIYYGCGGVRQPGYINVDVRWTPAVDLIGDLEWCARNFQGVCKEVYISHVLEHYGSPGKAMRDDKKSVLGALKAIQRMLGPGGIVRIAVPDYRALAEIYIHDQYPLYPRIMGRLMGEQDYPENRHQCVFDRGFLEYCLDWCGFQNFREWKPNADMFKQDGSFDEMEGRRTSLNLIAEKPYD